MTALTQAVTSLCQRHYIAHDKRNGCGRCPIYAQCTAPMQGWSWEALAEHNRKINDVAERRKQ